MVCTRSACVPFQSTHPARGATRRYVCTNEGWRFQSTHPARGATVRGGRPGSHRKNFNPRTPRGVRLLQEQEAELEQVFQSTHPARGATHRHIQGRQYSKISIHAPREGCDSSGLTRCAISHVFQSTHPARGATVFWYQPHIPQFYFNPRTPRGVRLPLFFLLKDSADFNPRTPRGVRQDAYITCDSAEPFQSTHPARGATANFTKEQRVCLAQFAYLHKGKKAEHTKTNAPMLHEAFLYAFWVRTGRRRRVLLDFARYKIKGSSGR